MKRNTLEKEQILPSGPTKSNRATQAKRGRPPGRSGESRICACSKPAVRRERGGWICADCMAKEAQRYGAGPRRMRQYSPNAKYADWMFRADRGHKTLVVNQ
jgi:hypothetical protein